MEMSRTVRSLAGIGSAAGEGSAIARDTSRTVRSGFIGKAGALFRESRFGHSARLIDLQRRFDLRMPAAETGVVGVAVESLVGSGPVAVGEQEALALFA